MRAFRQIFYNQIWIQSGHSIFDQKLIEAIDIVLDKRISILDHMQSSRGVVTNSGRQFMSSKANIRTERNSTVRKAMVSTEYIG
jgi:hypothetical protein